MKRFLILLLLLISCPAIADTLFIDSFEMPLPTRYSAVSYPNAPGSGTRYNVVITNFGAVFGHKDDKDAERPFPGRAGSSPAIWQYPGAVTNTMCFTMVTQPLHGSVGVSTYLGYTMDIGWSMNPWVFPIDPRYATLGAGPGDSGPTWSNYLTNKAYIPPGVFACLMTRLHTPVNGFVKLQLNNDFGP
jgi:hypothetical protein